MAGHLTLKTFHAFKKYGITLPYELAKWKCVRNRFATYANTISNMDFTALAITRIRSKYLYDHKCLIDDCMRIMNGERKILFFQDPYMKKWDPKYRWEEDRMQHLYPLAILASETKRQDVIDYYIREIRHYACNCHLQDTNAMEIAIASINLIVSYQMVELKDVETIIKQELQSNLIYILHNIEKGLVLSNNHYFFDLLGVLWITGDFQQDQLIQDLNAYAEQEMMNVLATIISCDGSLYEGSTYYTRYVAEALYEYVYYHPDKLNTYSEILKRLMSFLQGIASNGMIVGIGDNDSGRVLPICHYFSYCSRSILPIVDMNSRLELNVIAGENTGVFPDIGLLIIREDDTFVSLRCDSILNKKRNRILGGHEHNDQLSVQLFVGQYAIIVDPGTYLYISKDECRINNMRTRCHSTLYIEDLEQNQISNDWNYKERHAVAALNYADKQKLSTTVSYSDVVHHRTIILGDHNIEIVDKVETSRKGALTLMLSPTLCLETAEDNRVTFVSEALEVTIKTDTMITVEKAFYSKEYGIREETIKLKIGLLPSVRTNVAWKEKRKTI